MLINSSRKLDPDVPSPSQFDHVITLLPMGKEGSLDGYDQPKSRPSACCPITLRKKQALVIPRRAPALAPHLRRLRPTRPCPTREVSDIDGKINDIGKLEAHVQLRISRRRRTAAAIIFRRVPSANGSAWSRISTLGSGRRHHESQDQRSGGNARTVHHSYDVSKANFLDWSKKKTEIVLPLAQFNLPDVDEDDSDADAGTPQVRAERRVLLSASS